MRPLVTAFLALVLSLPSFSEVIWSQPRDFYVDPPTGWTFVEDPTPEHFVMTDPGRRIILEIFSQDKGPGDLKAKAADLVGRLQARGDQETFEWNGQSAWLADLTFTAGPVRARGWALVADHGNAWVSALAYAPETDFEKVGDTLVSTLNSLALGDQGRREPGPLSTFFQQTAAQPRIAQKTLPGLTPAFTLTYDLDRDEAVQAAMERETRILQAQIGPQVRDQKAIAPGWSRFYRQIYREFYSSLKPLADYWKERVTQKAITPGDLPQRVLSWLQSFGYARKGGLTDLSTPWETLSTAQGDCDSRSLVYLAVMDQLGISGILMVSAPYNHSVAALDWEGAGARFSFDQKQWMVAELTNTVNLGMIASDQADPNQWLGIDLWGRP